MLCGLLLSVLSVANTCSDTFYLKVHFLYGSRPKAAYRKQEPKWFGGIKGGHVGIEIDSGRIFSFVPEGSFHIVSKHHSRHSRFVEHNYQQFYSLFGTPEDSVRSAVIFIPIDSVRQRRFGSLRSAYLQQTPYDYALFGMRCAAAAYDVMAHLEIMPPKTRTGTYTRLFYPQLLRRKLFRQAAANGWKISFQEGSARRVWEDD